LKPIILLVEPNAVFLHLICKYFGDELHPVWLPDPPFNIPNTIRQPNITDDIV